MSAVTKSFRSIADKNVFYAVCGSLAGFPVLVLIYAAVKGEMQLGGFLAASFVTLTFTGFGVMYFFDTSELLLDEAGIKRNIAGRLCMPVAWSGIKVIREQFMANKNRGGQIRIDILPDAPGDFALRLRRTIKFSDQVENFDQLVAILNEKISQHSIRVEVCSNGIWLQRAELVATPER